MILLGYLFGGPSERRLLKEIQVKMAYRWFPSMCLTEKIPVASTLSQIIIRRLNDSIIFAQIFVPLRGTGPDSGNGGLPHAVHRQHSPERRYGNLQRNVPGERERVTG
ncbi:hypothetical protein C3Z09_02110 [Lelliottia aquatilis]|nr:hypothetical protein C3Z09_02110 [Lelliottia aquatilis]